MRKRIVLAMTLLILVVFASSANLTPAECTPAAEWDVVLTATKEGFSDTSEFGVRSDATLGFDTAYDELDPPEPPIGVVSYFWYPDNPTSPVDLRKLAKSKIGPSQQMNWTYKVKPVNVDGTMVVSWPAEQISDIPSECSVLLLNSEGVTVADMRLVTQHSFTAESGITYTFTIKVASARTLSIEVSGSGTTNPSPNTYTYNYGEEVVVEAFPEPGWMLDYWLLDDDDVGDVNPITVTMDSDHTLTAVFAEGWDVILTASMEGFSDTSEFGVRSDATLGFDTAYDQVDPPDPPMGVVSYFWYPDNDPMFRKLSVSKIPPSPPMKWSYNVSAVNIGEGTMCISWSADDVAQIPAEYGVYLSCPDGSLIDMRSVTEYCFPAVSDTTYAFEIFVGGCSFEYQLSAGWNMISFPCIPLDANFSDIFGHCGYYQVLMWDGASYITLNSSDHPECGQGYWVFVIEHCNVTLFGMPCLRYERDLPMGWSMIGSIYQCTVDADCVFPSFYQLLTWDGTSYVTSTVIEPGKGYWAFVIEPTHIVVDNSCCFSLESIFAKA